jgi:hypothetical protein
VTLQVWFGQGGAPDQFDLPGTDPIALPQPRPTPQVGNALTGGPHEGPWADHPGTPIFDGLVTARTSDTNGFCSPEPHVLGVVGGARPDPLPGHPGDPSFGGFVGAGGVGSTTDAWTTGFTDLGAGNEHGRPADGPTLALQAAEGLAAVSLAQIAAGIGGFNLAGIASGQAWDEVPQLAVAGDVNSNILPHLLVADPTLGGGAHVVRDGTTTGANAAAAARPDWAEALDLRFSNGLVGLGQAPAPPEVSKGVSFSTITLYETTEGEDVLANVIEATGAWNSVKNLETGPDAWSEALGTYLVVSNFVDVRMDFSNTPPDPEDEVGLDLVVHGVKRGEVTFGDGNANAATHFHSNEASWNNTFTVHAGTGRTDVVRWLAKSAPAPVTGLLVDNADPTNGGLWNPNYDGRYSRLEVFGGDGITIASAEQRVTLIVHGGRGLEAMYGADGDDILDGGGGYDLYTGGGGQDEFIFRYGEAYGDSINDFDGVGVAAGDVIRLLGFAPGTIVVDISQNEQSDATYGMYVPPYESEYLVGYFTAPKGLVVGQDIVFG